MKSFFMAALLAASALSGSVGLAQSSCLDIFSASRSIASLDQAAEQSAAVRSVVIEDGYKQWLLWEQTANVEKFRKPTDTIDVPLVEMSEDNVIVRTTSDAPAELINLFHTPDGNIYWAKHPYNTHSKVPFKNLPASASLPVYMTASRSLALDGKLRGFTIKLATNYPHGPDGERQDGKINTNDDIDSALIHTNHITEVDHDMGPDEKVLMLGEVMTMAEKDTGIGMVVRDVRLLDDGNYYLPALSIPYVGREIAALNGQPFDEFFKTYYAELLGEAKARLLLRYGLQMLTPNSQNMLIQFDRNMRPTGKIVFRDVSDAYLVDPVARGLGYKDQIDRDNAVEYPPKKEIMPYWSNSSWRFDEAGDKSVSYETVQEWGVAHNRAYLRYIENALGMKFAATDLTTAPDSFPSVYKILNTEVGQQKLRAYRKRMIEAEKARHQQTPTQAPANNRSDSSDKAA